MVEKFEIFVILCLLAFFRNSSAQFDKFACKNVVLKQEPTIVCHSSSIRNSILPLEQIPRNTTALVINATHGSLAITRVDIFRNLNHLQRMRINVKSLYFSQTLLHLVSVNHLQKILFSAPKLETLLLTYTQYSDESYSWMLPASVKVFHLMNRNFKFDISHCRNLFSLKLHFNGLSGVSSFKVISSSLVNLEVRHNQMNDFSVEDLADLCHLNAYAMDTSHMDGCLCRKLHTWIETLKRNGSFLFNGSWDCNRNNAHCLPDMKEALRRRDVCLKPHSPGPGSGWSSPRHKGGRSYHFNFSVFWILMVIFGVVFFGVLLAVFLDAPGFRWGSSYPGYYPYYPQYGWRGGRYGYGYEYGYPGGYRGYGGYVESRPYGNVDIDVGIYTDDSGGGGGGLDSGGDGGDGGGGVGWEDGGGGGGWDGGGGGWDGGGGGWDGGGGGWDGESGGGGWDDGGGGGGWDGGGGGGNDGGGGGGWDGGNDAPDSANNNEIFHVMKCNKNDS